MSATRKAISTRRSAMQRVYDVFVPTRDISSRAWLGHVRRGSGIVGQYDGGAERVLLHFEGNLYDAFNIVTYADRVIHAAGRLLMDYPTVAKAKVPPAMIVRVGTFDF